MTVVNGWARRLSVGGFCVAKIFSSVAQKKSRIDDEAKTRIRGTRFLCPPQFEPDGVRSGAQLRQQFLEFA